jgi:CBS domain containing-hemolysin-like protein
MSDTTAFVVAAVLLAGNAFFVGAEFALVSARRTKIEPRAATGSRTARTTLRAMENVSLMMAGAQLGITACSLGLGAIGEPAVAHLLERPFATAGVPDAVLHTVAFTLALAIVVFLHMVLGEMVPKNIALAGPERSTLALGPPLLAVIPSSNRPLPRSTRRPTACCGCFGSNPGTRSPPPSPARRSPGSSRSPAARGSSTPPNTR